MQKPVESPAKSHSVAPEIIRVAAGRVCGSDTFRDATKQQVLLRILVDAALHQRAATDAELVEGLYGDKAPEDVARGLVQHGQRLNAKLEQYFDDEGADDPVRFHFDFTHMALRFELWEREPDHPAPIRETSRQRFGPLGAGVLAAVAAAGVYMAVEYKIASRQAGTPDKAQAQSPIVPATLPAEAADMTPSELMEAGRDYLLPFLDLERQKMAVAFFQLAVEKDSNLVSAQASTAYCLATLALLTRGTGRSQLYLEEATEALEKALAMSPSEPWVLSAEALVSYTAGDVDRAIGSSLRAYAGQKEDAYIATAYALLAIFTARYHAAQKAIAEKFPESGSKTEIARARLFATASFGLQEYQVVLDTLEDLNAEGGAHNPVSKTLLAASYQAVGQTKKAQEEIGVVKTHWPNFRPDLVSPLYLTDQSFGVLLMDLLHAAGWPTEQ